MKNKPTMEELKNRVQSEIDHFDGKLPERVVLVWNGYLAALLEWGLVSPSDHQVLTEMLPQIPDNPVMAIFLGRK